MIKGAVLSNCRRFVIIQNPEEQHIYNIENDVIRTEKTEDNFKDMNYHICACFSPDSEFIAQSSSNGPLKILKF